jgi:hypothetical protein
MQEIQTQRKHKVNPKVLMEVQSWKVNVRKVWKQKLMIEKERMENEITEQDEIINDDSNSSVPAICYKCEREK